MSRLLGPLGKRDASVAPTGVRHVEKPQPIRRVATERAQRGRRAAARRVDDAATNRKEIRMKRFPLGLALLVLGVVVSASSAARKAATASRTGRSPSSSGTRRTAATRGRSAREGSPRPSSSSRSARGSTLSFAEQRRDATEDRPEGRARSVAFDRTGRARQADDEGASASSPSRVSTAVRRQSRARTTSKAIETIGEDNVLSRVVTVR